MPRIFNVSLHRTGTKSFHHFCRRNGLSAVHWAGPQFDKLCGDCVDTLDLEQVWRRYISQFSKIEAHSDLPCPSVFRQAARDLPDTRFVLILRKPSDWIKSIRTHTKDRHLDILEKLMYWPIMEKRKDRLSDYSDKELEAGLTKFISDVSAAMHDMRVPFFRIFSLESPDIGEQLARFLALPDARFNNVDQAQHAVEQAAVLERSASPMTVPAAKPAA